MSTADIYNAVLEYDEERVVELVRAELDVATDVHVILNDGLIAALDDVGRRFSEGTLFVPEMLLAAEAVQAGLEVIRPLLENAGAKPAGTVVIGTVKGDLHSIGKDLVATMLEGAGFQVLDLGTDVDPDQFVSAAQEHEADIIALSSLLTTSMLEMKNTVKAVAEANQTRNVNVKVIVGGPPIDQEFADTIGADAYAIDAPAAVSQARALVGE
jgi:5-methyltetrahydrofolate--homocysteine methyltransferase